MKLRAIAALAIFMIPQIANAQAIKPEPEMEKFDAATIAEIEMPDLQFEETEAEIKNYEKYFYFHRSDTEFDTAYADIAECDAMASGLSVGNYNAPTPYPYAGTMVGAAGSVIGNLMADAIFGSGERRKLRRMNIRKCMGYKGYDRYGMEKERWQTFHFEEGLSSVGPEKRRVYLLKQTKVASGPKPEQEVLLP